MSIKDNLDNIKANLPDNVTLVAVSKTKPVSDLLAAYKAGQRDFGENKIQEMEAKWTELPKDIRWHMIGHVQRNKVKYMAPFVSLIHGVDSLKLLKEIDKQAKRFDRTINCLLQVKIADEESKFGMDGAAVNPLLQSEEFKSLTHVKILGLMGMASFTDNSQQLKSEFGHLQNLYNSLKDAQKFTVLSMGMSGDYEIAIACQSTMIRIGSAIFGQRIYD